MWIVLLLAAALLHGAEGSVRGGGEGPDSVPAGALLGEGKQPPEGEGEEHQAAAPPGPAGHQQRAADSEPQAALRAQRASASPRPGHRSGPEEPSLEKSPGQKAEEIMLESSFRHKPIYIFIFQVLTLC